MVIAGPEKLVAKDSARIFKPILTIAALARISVRQEGVAIQVHVRIRLNAQEMVIVQELQILVVVGRVCADLILCVMEERVKSV
jgi:hypothetical protein